MQATSVSSLDEFAVQLARTVADFPESRLFVFPEMHLCDGDPNASAEAITAFAQPLRGERHAALSALAARHEIWLVPGSVFELGPDGEIYNTALVYSPTGELVASYRKIFPWRPFEACRPGSEFVTFDMQPYGRVGLSICYDSWFPEHGRQLGWLGAEMVINVVRTGTADRPQEVILAQANAIANQFFVLSVNSAAPGGVGLSAIVDPEGRLRGGSSDATPQVLSDEIDLAEARRIQQSGTAGLNRMWHQQHPDDAPILLPFYDGVLAPERIRPHYPLP